MHQRKNTICIRFPRKFFVKSFSYTGSGANHFALFYQSVNSLTRGRPISDVADIDTHDLIHRQVVNGVRRVYDYCDAVKCDGGAGQSAASSSFSSRDAMPIAKVPSIVPVMPEVESEVCRSMLRSGFTALYASISFSITRGYRGRNRQLRSGRRNRRK